MRAQVIHPRELDTTTCARWRAVVAQSAFSSAFFAPEWAQIVGFAHADARVAIWQGPHGEVFFPFTEHGDRDASAIGGVLSDYHGAVFAGTAPAWRPLLQACRLSTYRFDHLPSGQPFVECGRNHGTSPMMQLDGGMDGFYRRLAERGSKFEQWIARKRKAIERDVGPLRFVAHVTDATVLATLVDWKRQHYVRTDVGDIFTEPATAALIDHALAAHGAAHLAGSSTSAPASFGVALSALWAGDRLVAAHLGLHTPTTWHWWLPTYDRDSARYSPGQLLLVELAAHAANAGARTIDLGKGAEEYKERVATTAEPLFIGRADTSRARRVLRSLRHRIR